MPRLTGAKYPFTEAQVLKLLRLYKRERLLWDKNAVGYKDRGHRLAATTRIVRDMRLPKLEMRHIVFKMRLLRDVYVRELKKISARPENSKRIFPYWFYRMHFLKEHLNTTVDLSNVDVKEFTKEEEKYFGLDEEGNTQAASSKWEQASDEDEPDDILIVKGENDNDNDDIDNDEYVQDPFDASSDGPSVTSNRLDGSQFGANSFSEVQEESEGPSNDVNRALLGYLQDEKVRKQTDYFENFARYVASLLRALPRSKAFDLQPKIINMIAAEHKRLPDQTKSADNYY